MKQEPDPEKAPASAFDAEAAAPDGASSIGRRRFLASGASLVALSSASLVFAKANALAVQSASNPMLVPGLPARAYGERSSFESVSRSAADSHSLTPLQDLHGIVTPSSLHFERHHNGVPVIDPAAHRLLVHGLVARPLFFTVDDLQRFPSVSRYGVQSCFLERRSPRSLTRPSWNDLNDRPSSPSGCRHWRSLLRQSRRSRTQAEAKLLRGCSKGPRRSMKHGERSPTFDELSAFFAKISSDPN